MRKITRIIIHCSDTRPNWWNGHDVDAKANEIRRWHVEERGWNDIGYHFVCDRDGTEAVGRDISVIGAHARGHNRDSIGICLIGGHGCSANDTFKDHFTAAQARWLWDKIEQLRADHPTITGVCGHNALDAGKACPGFRVKKWMDGRENRPVASDNLRESTSVLGNLNGAVTGGGLVTAAQVYSGFDAVERYVIMGCGVVVLLGAAWLLRKKLLKEADRRDW